MIRNNLIRIYSGLILILLLSACSGSAPVAPKPLANKVSEKQVNEIPEEALLSVVLHNEFDVWKGTPYRFGGANKRGIDCSAFVQKIYLSSFNIKLPRTTYRQVRQGYIINKSKLQVGDLVFFKTSLYENHVGIFIGNNRFMHVSSSQGVMISRLNNVYWRAKYWQSRRIID